MQMDPASGWFQGVRHCPSPNFNARPGDEISLLIIHNISLPPGQFATGKVQEFFQNRLDVTEHPYFEGISALRVSAHFLIERDGTVTQFVSCFVATFTTTGTALRSTSRNSSVRKPSRISLPTTRVRKRRQPSITKRLSTSSTNKETEKGLRAVLFSLLTSAVPRVSTGYLPPCGTVSPHDRQTRANQ